ncbi:DUF1674 domain-containing protein [Flexibacterium corallicola]|uniref:DUF1674 domain-containing protein n=1 Tax=Flexibacterium corallicola TaxID=3037259 RepID=UPI00286F321A|nr:DUF1674 domain-containing protein [Pseudovibrio sp. M1P-2-3]
MSNSDNSPSLSYSSKEIHRPEDTDSLPKKKRFEDLPPAAQRALKEAEERRAHIDQVTQKRAKELNGRGGLDPARYNDWEVKGITSDF